MEYSTKDEAATAINTMSNRNLMGRLIYVREVCSPSSRYELHLTDSITGPRDRASLQPRRRPWRLRWRPTARWWWRWLRRRIRWTSWWLRWWWLWRRIRWWPNGWPADGRPLPDLRVKRAYKILTLFGTSLTNSQLPYNVGWQDLKDLFRQGGKFPR